MGGAQLKKRTPTATSQRRHGSDDEMMRTARRHARGGCSRVRLTSPAPCVSIAPFLYEPIARALRPLCAPSSCGGSRLWQRDVQRCGSEFCGRVLSRWSGARVARYVDLLQSLASLHEFGALCARGPLSLCSRWMFDGDGLARRICGLRTRERQARFYPVLYSQIDEPGVLPRARGRVCVEHFRARFAAVEICLDCGWQLCVFV